jgi:hypothetical protein
MVGLIVAARWLEKASFEAQTGGMAESNRPQLQLPGGLLSNPDHSRFVRDQ